MSKKRDTSTPPNKACFSKVAPLVTRGFVSRVSKKNKGSIVIMRFYKKKVIRSMFILTLICSTIYGMEVSKPNNVINEEKIEEVRIFPVPSEQETTAFIEENNLDFSFSRNQNAGETNTCFGLSLDGGGIRGLMPAIWLRDLANELKEQEGIEVPLHQVFDYVGGTSIGGILSLGVAAGMTPETLISFFQNEKKRKMVFSTEGRKMVRLLDFFGLVSHRYNGHPLEALLRDEFGAGKTLQDLKTDVLVPACTTAGDPYIFKKGAATTPNYKLWEVARCTSAAPTYFSAYQPSLNGTTENQPSLVDGGFWINNPSTLVAASIVKEYQGGNFNPEKIYMLSLGTGEATNGAISTSSGKLEAAKFIDCLMSSHSRGNHLMMSQLLGNNYYRVNVSMDESIELDDISLGNINALSRYAEREDNMKVIKKFVKNSSESIREKLERIGCK